MHGVPWVSILCSLYAYPSNQINLQEPAEAQQTFSHVADPTIYHTLPVLEYLQEQWSSMVNVTRFASIAPTIQAGLDNLNKWYNKTEHTNAHIMYLSRYIFI